MNTAGHLLTGAGLDTGTAVTAVGIGMVGVGVAAGVAVGWIGVEEAASVGTITATTEGISVWVGEGSWVGVGVRRGLGICTVPAAWPVVPKISHAFTVTV